MVIAIYMTLGLLIVGIEGWKFAHRNIDFASIANVFFLLTYVATPCFYISQAAELYSASWDTIEMSLFCIVTGYIAFALGWTACKRTSIAAKQTRILSPRLEKQIVVCGMLVSAIAVVGYLSSYGGMKSALINGAFTRYGYLEVEQTRLAFTGNLLLITSVTTLMAFYYVISKQGREIDARFWWRAYIISCSILVLQVFVEASRGLVMNIVLLHIYMLLLVRKRLSLGGITGATIFGSALLMYGKQTFFATASLLSGSSFRDAFLNLDEERVGRLKMAERFFKEYVHGISSLDAAIHHSGREVGLTYFSDFIWALLRVVPQRIIALLTDTPRTISRVNTELLSGVDIASMPPGIIGHCYYALGPLGVIIGMFCYGAIGRVTQNTLQGLYMRTEVYVVFYVMIAVLFGGFISNGDPNVYIYSLLWPLIALFVVYRLSSPIGRAVANAREHVGGGVRQNMFAESGERRRWRGRYR